MAKTLFRILPLAAAMLGVLAVPGLEARGGGGHFGGHGGFRGGFRGGMHGGHGGHGGHNFHRGDHHRHHGGHHHNRFRRFNRFGNVLFSGYGGYGGYYPYGYDNSAYSYPQENLIPVAPATPVQKGYSTCYSADGCYNYPRFYNPEATTNVSQIIVNACCPAHKSSRKTSRRTYKKKPCLTQPLSVAERIKTKKSYK